MEELELVNHFLDSYERKGTLNKYNYIVKDKELYYGTSDCLGAKELLSLDMFYDVPSLDFVVEFRNKVFAVDDLCMAKYMSRCAARKYGGHPVVYKICFKRVTGIYRNRNCCFYVGDAFDNMSMVDFHTVYKEKQIKAYEDGNKKRYIYTKQARSRMRRRKKG